MMDFLTKLRSRGIRLWLEDDNLRYHAPKGAMTKELLTEISERKDEIIHFFRRTRMELRANEDPVTPVLRDEKCRIPLTYSQQSMWVYDQLVKGNAAFNIFNAVKVTGVLDKNTVERALKKLINRHEALRTTFKNVDGKPVQVISQSDDVKLHETHLGYCPDEESLTELLKEEARLLFDLEKGPLFRFHLFTLGEKEYVLTMTMHHIISDGWSNGVLVSELFTLYKAFVEGRTENLPELSIQFSDYAFWERNRLKGDLLKDLLDYWKRKLQNPTVLKLPLDRKRPLIRSFEGRYESLKIPKELTQKLDGICKRYGVTMFMLLLAALKTVLYRYSGQKDIMAGTVVANRNRKELRNLVGFFINTLVLRTSFEGDPDFTQLLKRVKQTATDAYTYQDLPFDKMLEELNPPREAGLTPLFQVMFILQNTQKAEMGLPGVKMEPLDVESTMAPFDLRLQLTEADGGLKGGVDYNSSIFEPVTIKLLVKHLLATLQCVAQNPEMRVSKLPLFEPGEEAKILKKTESMNREALKVAVSATFTSEPVEDYINWWCRQFGVDVQVQFAPYNQIFQQVLDSTSLISSNDGINILLVRFEDWLRADRSGEEEQFEKLKNNFDELLNIIRNKEKAAPYFIGIFPVATHLDLSTRVLKRIEELYGEWKSVLEGMENVYTIDLRELARAYNIDKVFDAVKDTEGHLPFSDMYYAAMGTAIARKICAWRKQLFKVIVLDCDNTLWRGICGEDGAEGVRVDGPYTKMQEFMLERSKEGMLLAICSKNNEADVWEVFDKNPGMIFKKDHFVNWKINWQSKSANIKEMANELNLGLDSFIFIDDSPAECTEMMMERPEVLTLKLPDDPDQIPAYLRHSWAFDRFGVTEEDAARTKMYLAEKKRQAAQGEERSLDGFIKGLELKMSMNLMEDFQIARVSQLTQRTNQFNLSTIRRTQEEIRNLDGMPGVNCHVIEVCDRFGDYGISGVVITKECEDRLVLDTLLLSCRVLGRRIEDALLGGLKKLCQKSGVDGLEADFYPTEKNMPIKAFLERTGWKKTEERGQGIRYTLDVESIPDTEEFVECYFDTRFEKGIKHIKREGSSYQFVAAVKEEIIQESVISNNKWEVTRSNSKKLIHKDYLLPLENPTGRDLIRLPVHKRAKGDYPGNFVAAAEKSYMPPQTEVQKVLVDIWREMLGVEKIGINDDFFLSGGNSLIAVSIVTRLREKFGFSVPLYKLLENRTIAKLGGVIEEALNSNVYERKNNEIIKKVPESQQGKLPLSFLQQSMWFYDQLTKGNPVFNMTSAVKISGGLNKDYLKAILVDTVKCHHSLRTNFKSISGTPVQVINVDVEVELKEIDLTKSNVDEYDYELEKLLKKEAQYVFDLEKGPLFRFCLFILGESEFVFSMTLHHIISDGWSNTVLVGELFERYRSMKEGKSTEFHEPPIKFCDYAYWERSRFEGEKLKSLFSYWRKQLSNPTTLELPLDRVRPKNRTYEGGFEPVAVSSELAEELSALANRGGVTLFMIILAAFQTLLYRYSGQKDIFTGTVVANRNREETENIVGPFINTLVLRTDFEEEPSFLELLQRVKRTTLEAYEHQELPFDKMLEELRPERDLSRSPLFQVMFILHNNKRSELCLPGLKMKEIEVDTGMAPFDLRLQLKETENGLKGGFDYCSALFEPSTISRISTHLLNMLENIVSNPMEKVSKLKFISKSEEEQILFEFNNTVAQYPKNRVINEYLEEKALKEPENIAVVFKDRKISYGTLNRKANQLARLLKEKNVGLESITAVMMERSTEMIIAIMAVEKAGGAYLPIDPHYPLDRIEFVLKDSGAKIVLTHKEYIDCEAFKGVEIIDLDDEGVFFGDDSNLLVKASPNNVSYVIYTSGSTGKPKGTLIEHHSLINRLNWMQKKYPIGKEDTILQKTPYTFDVSVWEMFWWSMKGARLCFLEPGAEKDPGKIVEAIEKNNITVIHFVPSMLNLFLEYIKETNEIKRVSSLKQVFASGEALTPGQVKEFNALLGKNGTELANLYGPTEATIDVSYFDCSREKDLDTIPIGKPIDNTKLLIMDNNMQLQPVGVPGELCIGGVGLAREYLKRPELTEEKFVQNPYRPRERLYRTGDLVKWRPDGNIEYLGRMDFQVKIRGLRIELGEIERVLSTHPFVNECVVTAWNMGEGDIHLVGYVVCEKDKSMESSGIKGFLAKSLPEYMIPGIFVFLENMPLSSNGKIDRKSLPVPSLSSDRIYEAPNNEVEKALVDIWQKVLGVYNIGINDNFFEIGGDSLKAMQTVIYLRKKGLKLEIRDLFEKQTIKNLGGCIEFLASDAQQEIITGEVGLIPTQKGFFRKTRTDINHWNISVMLFKKYRMDEEILKRVFEKIVEHHDALRMIYKIDKERITQINRGVDCQLFEFTVFNLVDDKDDTTRMDADVYKLHRSMDLQEGPLVKLALFRRHDGDHLLLAVHHLVCDGLSLMTILEDSAAAYNQAVRNEPIKLPMKTSSLKAWSEKLEAYANSQELLKETEYWKNLEEKPVAPLPKDKTFGEDRHKHDETIEVTLLSSKETKVLVNGARKYDAEVKDLLVTAFGKSMKEWTGENNILIDYKIHGRENIFEGIDVTRTVGWFATEFPAILDMSDIEDIRSLITTVRDMFRNVPGKGLGYETLRDITLPQNKKSLSLSLNPEILFNYSGEFKDSTIPDFEGFSVSPLYKNLNESPDSERKYTLIIELMILQGNLDVTIHYNKYEYYESTIRRLLESFRENLVKITELLIDKEEQASGW